MSLLDILDLLVDIQSPTEPALIPPPLDLSCVEDIYCVGVSSSDRWRQFIDCDNWDPKQFHDTLLQRRAYHARVVWEVSYLISFTESNWIALDAMTQMKDIANLELRVVEIKIISFQLTCNMIGILTGDRQFLYRVVCLIHLASVEIGEKIYTFQKRDKLYLQAMGEVRRTKPLPSDSVTQLGKNFDIQISGLSQLCEVGLPFIVQHNESQWLAKYTEKLKLIVFECDKLLKINDEKK